MLHINEEAARCLLCHDAPCGAKVARAIRAARFDNLWTAAKLFNAMSDEELAHAEASCIHYDKPIRIAELANAVSCQPSEFSHQPSELPSLKLNFCDMICENPFFLASSAICTNYDMVARALEAVAALRCCPQRGNAFCRFPQHGAAQREPVHRGF